MRRPISDRHWSAIVELVVTAAACDADHVATLAECGRAMLALSDYRQERIRGEDRAPNTFWLQRISSARGRASSVSESTVSRDLRPKFQMEDHP